jgi:hypothetical protein
MQRPPSSSYVFVFVFVFVVIVCCVPSIPGAMVGSTVSVYIH